MRVTLADLMKEAFAKAGEELPKDKNDIVVAAKAFRTKSRPTLPQKSSPVASEKKVKKKAKKEKNNLIFPAHAPVHDVRKSTSINDQSFAGLWVYSTGMNPRAPKKKVEVDHNVDFELTENSSPSWSRSDDKDAVQILNFSLSGQQVQPRARRSIKSYVDHELSLGIDFGTSSVKAIIGDIAQKIAFAVPFRDAPKLARYLLPCTLHKNNGDYSLFEGGDSFSDLKLSLLAFPQDKECIERAIAFLALTIRQIRAWFFEKHDTIYRANHILWRLSVGIPSADHLKPEMGDLYRRICFAAWVLAGSQSAQINVDAISQSLVRVDEIESGATPLTYEDIEVSVVPEIAAQVYGYVASENFDKKAANNFMLVDVGAGTVDACVFHVKPVRGKWDFEFYTTTVEQNGSMNLHRNRLRWLEDAIQSRYPKAKFQELLDEIAAERYITDRQFGIPGQIEQYLTESKIHFHSSGDHVDRIFYFDKVFLQVANKTYYESFRFLGKRQLEGIPVYLCGGGMRSPFYQQLQNSLVEHHSLQEWMRKLRFRKLTVPSSLRAPYLPETDYDRLSVAYGLSFLNLGRVLKAIPMPRVPLKVSDSWRDNYIDK